MGGTEVLVGRTELRVRYAEVDQMGTVYHGNYFAWFEVGRTELMRSQGIIYRELEAAGYGLPVIDCGATFRSPARYDDVVAIESRLVHANRLRMELRYELRRVATGELLATGFTRHVYMDQHGKPRRLPASSEVWRKLESLVNGAVNVGER
ncbi:MAG: acyl-CoA thioesterase [Chloroflexi bacterium]|nr:acyl-CoA thioesterase [Chloroflexota bacterium]